MLSHRLSSARLYSALAVNGNTQFDTFNLFQTLQKDTDLKDEQSKAIMDAYAVVLDSKISTYTNKAISKADYERSIYGHRIDLIQLKNDVQQNQRNEAMSSLLTHEQLMKDLHSGRQKIREKLANLRSEIRFEISMEKGKMRDSMMMNQLKYQDLYSSIDTEVSTGYTTTGKLRHEIFYSLTGFFFTSAAALLGYLRYSS
jgi:hypothetical protein